MQNDFAPGGPILPGILESICAQLVTGPLLPHMQQ